MSYHIYKIIELTGTSITSIENAVENAIKHVHKTHKDLCWFEVGETRGNLENGKIQHWQVTIKIGVKAENPSKNDH